MGGDERGESISGSFVPNWELYDDAVNTVVGVGREDFVLNIRGRGRQKVDNFDANVFAIADF